MKTKTLLMMAAMMAAGFALGALADDTQQMKADLVGQTMGGRESAWKFQSADQIKSLKVEKKDEVLNKRVYKVALELQATNNAPRYAADAQVEYTRTGSGWKIHHVGLLSLRRMK
jgi:hypothetical protein